MTPKNSETTEAILARHQYQIEGFEKLFVELRDLPKSVESLKGFIRGWTIGFGVVFGVVLLTLGLFLRQ